MTYDFGPEQMCIPLTRGKFATIDVADAPLVGQHKWFAIPWKGTKSVWYAQGYKKNNYGRRVLMHRILTGAKKGELVDHHNGFGLVNRRGNLRIANNASNCANQQSHRRGHYKGVFKSIDGKQWRALISGTTGSIVIGMYPTAEDAARAYDDAARAKWGEFACVNFPRHGERSALPDGWMDLPPEKLRISEKRRRKYEEMVRLLRAGLTVPQVAKTFNTSDSHVCRCCKYLGYRSVGEIRPLIKRGTKPAEASAA